MDHNKKNNDRGYWTVKDYTDIIPNTGKFRCKNAGDGKWGF